MARDAEAGTRPEATTVVTGPARRHSPSPTLARARRLGYRVTPGMVRRTLKRWKPKDAVPESYDKVDQKVRSVDSAVDSAYARVAGQLKDGELSQLDGVSKRRFGSWVTVMKNPLAGDNLKAAATGYIIEDNATYGFKDDPMVQLQATDTLKETRPDVVIRDTSESLFFPPTGYLDITSSRDAGHVFDKKGNWGGQAYVAESLYPSFDFSDLSSGPLKLDEDAMRLVEEWREQRAERKWKQVQKAYRYGLAEYNREQKKLVKALRTWSSGARRKIVEPQPSGKVRRRRSYRGGMPGEFYTGRKISAMAGKIRRWGVSIDPDDGRISKKTYDQYLDARGIPYTKEQVRAMYALA